MHPLNRITSRTEQSHPWHHHRQQHRHIVYMVHDASLTTYVYLFENWEGKGQFDGAADRNRLRCRRNRIRAVQRIHIHHTWSLLVLSPMMARREIHRPTRTTMTPPPTLLLQYIRSTAVRQAEPASLSTYAS
jgi:hypothetical protein